MMPLHWMTRRPDGATGQRFGPALLVTRACLVAVMLTVPSGTALALAIVDSSLTITNLSITPASGSASFEAPLATSATTHAFSLGEEVFDGNSGVVMEASAAAVVTYAHGTAQALTSSNSVGGSASVNLRAGQDVLIAPKKTRASNERGDDKKGPLLG